MVGVIEGSLRFTFPVSSCVYKDANGVWQYMEVPPFETLQAAQTVLAGRPQWIDEATAAELTTAGIGTVTTFP